MAAERIDLYTPFHKGIRKMLFDLAVAVGKTDFRDDEAATFAVAEVRRIIAMLREHSMIEDQCFHPAIEERAPGATAELADEHTYEEELLNGIEEHVARLASAERAHRPDVGLQLYRAINLFNSSYLGHLANEEQHLMPQFWDHFTDEELIALRSRAQTTLAPERMVAWVREVLKAFNADERVSMLGAIKHQAPPAAWETIAAVAREVLSADEWQEAVGRLDRE